MNVIADTAYGMWNAVDAADNAAEIGVELRANGGFEPWFAVLCAEYQMVVKRGMCRWHGPPFWRPFRARIIVLG